MVLEVYYFPKIFKVSLGKSNMSQIIEKAKNLFLKNLSNYGKDPYNLKSHILEVEEWIKHLRKKYSEADEEVLVLSAWLHDIGHYPIKEEIDHAVTSEKIAKEFLTQENYSEEKIKKVLHCVRSHRCNDVMPQTIEAKILAFSDSASHMTTSMYFDMAKTDKVNKNNLRAHSKIERDYRDLSPFPEFQTELKPLFDAWKNLIKSYDELDFY